MDINMVKSYKEKKDEFQHNVLKYFGFLEEEFSFIYDGVQTSRSSDPRDKYVKARFRSDNVGVEITWMFGECQFSVHICELDKGGFPKENSISLYGHSGYFKAISIDEYVEYCTNGSVKSIMPDTSGEIGNKELMKLAEMKRAYLENQLSEIISKYAHKLRKYCDNILQGDLSCFEKAQQYYKEKWGEWGIYR